LPRAAIVRCQAFECDFTETDLSHTDLRGSDFKGSTFARTNLGHADLREARNYAIDPTANTIRKARFSLPDALVLLNAFDIEVE
jgi:fluoroquinolone resistance protein